MRNRYVNTGWFITVVVALLPIVLWQIALPVPWDNAKNIFENIGRLAGLAGMALFAWNVLLSARLKIYNKLFLGLDNTYRAHHIIGSTAFILLLIHPLAITYRYFLSSPISAYEFIKPNLASPFRLVGTVALAMMTVLMIITLYINVKYELFVMAQRLLGLVLFIGGLHAIFVGGSSLRGGVMSLTVYYAVLLIAAAVVYIYRSVFHGNFAKYHRYKISKIINHDAGIYDLILSPADEKPLKFTPGQFAFIKTEEKGLLSQSHPFSMSSSPNDSFLRFSIKDLGDYTRELGSAKPGTIVKIDGGYGTFSNQVIKSKRQIWIAGGIGISPFLSMAHSLEEGQEIDLYYSVKTKDEAVYLSELMRLPLKKPGLKILPYYADESGFLSADYIFKNSNSPDEAVFLICGPAALMNSLRKQLRNKNIPNRKIHTEEFNFS